MTAFPAPPDHPRRPGPRPRRVGRSLPSLRAITALILREMGTTYGRSPGGYLWAVLEPAAGIALLSLVFSVGFRAPSLGISFPMFYATGMLPFLMFSIVVNKVAQSLNFSRPLLVYPSVTFVDSLIARFVLNILTQLMVSYVVIMSILLLFDTRITPDLSVIAQAFGLTALLAMGIGTLNAFLTTQFPVWQQAWNIIMRPMFLISCIFFLFESIPQPYRDYLWWNPLVHVIGLMRRGFYATYDGPYISVTYVVAISLICLSAGLLFLRRFHRDLLNR